MCPVTVIHHSFALIADHVIMFCSYVLSDHLYLMDEHTKRHLKDRISDVRINNYLGVCVCVRERKCFTHSDFSKFSHISRTVSKIAD